MRLINADAIVDKLKKDYKIAQGLNDTELMKTLVVCKELINNQPTEDPVIINEKYQALDFESRKAFDQLLDCMYKETLRRNGSK